jgi:hypothetical protein
MTMTSRGYNENTEEEKSSKSEEGFKRRENGSFHFRPRSWVLWLIQTKVDFSPDASTARRANWDFRECSSRGPSQTGGGRGRANYLLPNGTIIDATKYYKRTRKRKET